MYGCMCVLVVHIHRSQRLTSGIFLNHSLPFILRYGLSLEPRALLWESLVSICLVQGRLPLLTSVYVGSGDLNSGTYSKCST